MKTLHLIAAQDDVVGQETQLLVSQTALETEEDPTVHNARVPDGLDGALHVPDTGPTATILAESGEDENSAAFLKRASEEAAPKAER